MDDSSVDLMDLELENLESDMIVASNQDTPQIIDDGNADQSIVDNKLEESSEQAKSEYCFHLFGSNYQLKLTFTFTFSIKIKISKRPFN